MTTPEFFRQSKENFIQSYDWTDIASGTGYIRYYLMEVEGDDNILSSNADYSDEIEETQTAKNSGDYVEWDLTPFNKPTIIRGQLRATIGLSLTQAGATATYLKLKAYNYDGTTATLLAEGNLIRQTGIGTTFKGVKTAQIDIPKTKFKKGDILRLRLELYFGGVDTANFTIGQDPMNRDGAILTPSTDDSITASYIQVPFDISL